MAATVRLGTCSWADEGLVKTWYPKGVSTAEARLRYYAQCFDTVEVDSTFYALPDPAVAAKWVERTPPEFVFHVKASGEMTHHREAESMEQAFGAFRAALEPLELSGKWRGVLLQYHPRFKKSDEAKDELARVRELRGAAGAARRVPSPLLARGAGTGRDARVPRAARARLRLGGRTADAGLERHARRRGGDAPVAYVRFHGRNWRTWNIRGATKSWERFDWEYSPEELGEWVEPVRGLAEQADEVYALFNVNRDDQGPRGAAVFRGLLDEGGIDASGGIEPPSAQPTLF